MSSTGWAAVLVLILVIAGGAWWYTAKAPTVPPPQANSDQGIPDNGVVAPKTVTVLYGTDGFSPSEVTIKQGDTVTFVNNGGDEMWVASAPHPAHTGYDGTDRATHCAAGYTGTASFDQCAASTNYSFMFTKVGTWPYHNHSNASHFGRVVVE